MSEWVRVMVKMVVIVNFLLNFFLIFAMCLYFRSHLENNSGSLFCDSYPLDENPL